MVASSRTGTDSKQIEMAVRTTRCKGSLSEAELSKQLSHTSQRVRDEIQGSRILKLSGNNPGPPVKQRDEMGPFRHLPELV